MADVIRPTLRGKKKLPRRAWGSYRYNYFITTEQRALFAVDLVEKHKWPIGRASAMLGVCPTNAYFAKSLGADDRSLLAEGRVTISHLWKRQARLRRWQAAAERKAKAEAPAAPIPTVMDAASISRLVDELVARFGAGVWMDAVDRATAPGAPKPAANGNGAAAHA